MRDVHHGTIEVHVDGRASSEDDTVNARTGRVSKGPNLLRTLTMVAMIAYGPEVSLSDGRNGCSPSRQGGSAWKSRSACSPPVMPPCMAFGNWNCLSDDELGS